MEIEERGIGSNSLFLDRQKMKCGRKKLGMILPQQPAPVTYSFNTALQNFAQPPRTVTPAGDQMLQT